MHCLEWKILNFAKNSLKYVPSGLIDNVAALVQIMAWCWIGGKIICEPIIVCCTDAYMAWGIYVFFSLNKMWLVISNTVTLVLHHCNEIKLKTPTEYLTLAFTIYCKHVGEIIPFCTETTIYLHTCGILKRAAVIWQVACSSHRLSITGPLKSIIASNHAIGANKQGHCGKGDGLYTGSIITSKHILMMNRHYNTWYWWNNKYNKFWSCC